MIRSTGGRALHLALLATALAHGGTAAEPPIAMADPNGQALRLRELDVRIAAHGPLALTELEMVFENPLRRQVEGRFACTLPVGATVSRFAKDVNGRLMEGEVVERLKATRVYTEILHTMRDPALLEQEQGNRFSARIFPIPASGRTRLLLSYTTSVPAGPDGKRTMVVPLAGIRQAVDRFSFRAVARPLPGETVVLEGWLGSTRKVETGETVVFEDEGDREDFRPTEDVRLVFDAGAVRAHRVEAGDYQLVTMRPPVRAREASAARPGFGVLVDTSASFAAGGSHRLDAADALLAALGPAGARGALEVEAFDLEVEAIARTTLASPDRDAIRKGLATRRFLGATDLAAAARRAGELARREGGPGTVVLLTDGVATAGSRDPAEVVAALGAWPAGARLMVVVLGSIQDTRMTEALAEAGGGRVLAYPLDTAFRERAREVARELLRPPGESFRVVDEAAEWIQPSEFRDVRAGAELVAFSLRRRGVRTRVRFVRADGEEFPVEARPVGVDRFETLVARSAHKAYLKLLETREGRSRDPAEKRRLREEQIRISTENRVLCNHTAMLVLETERDYRRFEIDRRALVDIMRVGPGGIETISRKDPFPPKPRPKPRPRPIALRPAPGGAPGLVERAVEAMKSISPFHGGSASYARSPRSRGVSAPALESAPAPSMDMAPMVGGADELRRAPAPRRMLRASSFSRGGAARASRRASPGRLGQVAESTDAFMGDASGPHDPTFAGGGSSGASFHADEEDRDDGYGGGDGDGDGDGGDDLGDDMDDREEEEDEPSGPVTWISQAHEVPTPSSLRRLRAEVAKAPRDRRPRNAYAWALLRAGDLEELRDQALDWQGYDPQNPMVYEFLGEAFGRLERTRDARRAMSSIAEVAPNDSGLLNRAGYLALARDEAAMAETLFRAALARRPDHHNNYRGLALALWTQGRHADAADALVAALRKGFHERYGNLRRVLREELGSILAAWKVARPEDSKRIAQLARTHRVDLARRDALRVTLAWETDANDVDLHVVDPAGEECYYSHKRNRSGLNLYEDLTEGLGPEVAVVPPGRLQKGSYHVGVTYFDAGPMGVSRGVVLVQHPAVNGRPRVDVHTFTLLPDLEGGDRDMRHVAVIDARP